MPWRALFFFLNDQRLQQTGYYDRNGRWVPARSQPQQQGYNDRCGNYHPY